MINRFWVAGLLLCCMFAVLGGKIEAQGVSDNFRIDESFIGPGGNLESSSDNFKLDPGQSSVGNPGGVGGSASDNFQTQAGATTTADPRLSCSITAGSLNFGSLSTGVTTTGTANFSVSNYTSYGYNVSILGNSLTNGSHTLSPMSSNGSSQIGNEQFGINLRANTTPAVGTEPTQVPTGDFSFGTPTSNYNTANSYRYVPGETIAHAPKSSGQTDYTISYIVNAATTTPGGRYTTDQTILCTGTY